jgi:hypothetical protein
MNWPPAPAAGPGRYSDPGRAAHRASAQAGLVGIVGGPAAGRLAGVDFNQVAMVVSGKLTVAFGLIT